LAKTLGQRLDARNLIGYGTLYKALERLEKRGALESDWEDPSVAERERRPRRRLYRVTALGAKLSLTAPAGARDSSVRRTKAYPA
jgi:DNA-binding PadR family transcriptional regulator